MSQPIYDLTPELETILWNDAIFVFDTSALMYFHILHVDERRKIITELFVNKLKERLWLPEHVKKEYDKNKVKSQRMRANEFKELEDKLKKIDESIEFVSTTIDEIKDNSTNKMLCTYMSQEGIDKYIDLITPFKVASKLQGKLIEDQIKQLKDTHTKCSTDDIENLINSYFKLGLPFKLDETLKIIQEGELRYKYQIPPGWKDQNKDNNMINPIDKFGDLIIWKQIIVYAKQTGQPIIFVTNDLKDSYDKDKNKPDFCLIKEIYDITGVNFWMYPLSLFLTKSKEVLDVAIDQKAIDAIVEFEDKLIVECSECGELGFYEESDLDLDFCLDQSHYLDNGRELLSYSATHEIDCECGNTIEMTFHVFGSPYGGKSDDDDYECYGGEIIQCFELPIDCFDEDDR